MLANFFHVGFVVSEAQNARGFFHVCMFDIFGSQFCCVRSTKCSRNFPFGVKMLNSEVPPGSSTILGEADLW